MKKIKSSNDLFVQDNAEAPINNPLAVFDAIADVPDKGLEAALALRAADEAEYQATRRLSKQALDEHMQEVLPQFAAQYRAAQTESEKEAIKQEFQRCGFQALTQQLERVLYRNAHTHGNEIDMGHIQSEALSMIMSVLAKPGEVEKILAFDPSFAGEDGKTAASFKYFVYMKVFKWKIIQRYNAEMAHLTGQSKEDYEAEKEAEKEAGQEAPSDQMSVPKEGLEEPHMDADLETLDMVYDRLRADIQKIPNASYRATLERLVNQNYPESDAQYGDANKRHAAELGIPVNTWVQRVVRAQQALFAVGDWGQA